MREFISRYSEEIGGMLLTFALSGLYASLRGVYFDSNDDPLFAELMRGTFFGAPVSDFFIYHKLLAKGYAFLYGLSDLPWYSIFMMLYFFCSASIILMILNGWMKKESGLGTLARGVVLSGIFFVGFAESITHLSFTRNSILLCAAGILLLLYRKYNEQGNLKRTKYVLPIILFVLGTLTRPQSAMLVLGLCTPFIFFIYGKGLLFRKTFQFILPFVLVLAADKVIDLSTSSEPSAYYRSVIPYLFNILDAGTSHLPEYPTEADMTRYQAVSQWFLSDRQTVNAEFLSRISSADIIGTSKVNALQAREAIRITFKSASGAQLLFLFLVFIIALASCITGGKDFARRNKLLLPLLLFNFLFVDMLLFITVFIKMVPRVLDPSLTILIILNVLVIAINLGSFKDQVYKWVLPASTIICLIVLVLSLRSDAFIMTRNFRSGINAQVMAAANREYKDKQIVFTLMSMSDISENSPAFRSPFSRTNRYMIIDGGWTTLVGEFPKQIRELTGREDLPSLLKYFRDHSSDFVFISTPDRNDLIRSYMSRIYGIRLDFRELHNSSIPSSGFGFYQLN